MVESQGMKRQDTVFALSCNKIDEIFPWSDIPQGVLDLEREDCYYTNMFDPIMDTNIFPWSDIPQGVLDLEREDCYYTNMFDPIMDTNVSYTCAPREYLAGITRVTDTRIQTMCCRLRTRDEANCENIRFGKPLGYDGKVEIQLKGKLINALTVEKNLYNVRFCDLVPRAIGAILNDIKTTTVRPITTTTATTTIVFQSTSEHTTSAPLTTTIISNKLTEEQIKEKTVTEDAESFENDPLISESENTVAEENDEKKLTEEDLNFSNDDETQDSELLNTSTDMINNENNKTISEETSQISVASKEEASAEEKILSPLPIPTKNSTSSMEVQASPMPRENVFPSDKDYENIEEAEAELMTTIAEMIKARNIAKNIISKVKAAGVKQQVKQKQEEMAEQLLREIEGQTDPAKADELFKQSIEMLNELSEAKQIMSTEEFSKEMMRQEDEQKKAAESALVDSLQRDVFDPIKHSSEKLTIFSLPHIFTHSPLVAQFFNSNVANVQSKMLPIDVSKSHEFSSKSMSIRKEGSSEKSRIDYPVKTNTAEKIISTLSPPTYIPSAETTTPALPFAKPLHTTNLPYRTTTLFTDISQSLEDVFEYSKSKSLFFKKHNMNPFLKPSIENGPSKEVLLAASSSNEARRAPAKYFEEPYATLPPLNKFPSPPSQTKNRPKPLELPRLPQPHEQEEEYQSPIIELDEYDELLRSTTPYPYFYKSYKKHTTIPHLAPNARGNFVDQPYVDELTRLSPFETSYENRILPSPRPRFITTTSEPTTTPEVFIEETTEYVPSYETSQTFKVFPHDKSPFDYPEIRRAPIPKRTAFEEYKKFDDIQKNQLYMEKIALDSILSKNAEVQSETINIASKEQNPVDTNDGEGIISYKPVNNKEMKIEKAEEVLVNDDENHGEEAEYQNEQEVENHQNVETLVPMNAVEKENTIEVNTTETAYEDVTTTTTVEASTTTHSPIPLTTPVPEEVEYYAPEYQDMEPEAPTYDPRAFYHTLPPRPVTKKERYLTFCTKDLAIRDSNNMIVACGNDNEVWIPKRCPDGTDCFYTTDSTYRICCPVANG
uniref:Uncharacterized protein n=1 Tax=Panagrolaimus sp. ES5 TaxID=591445 RepID=A0AC34GXC8_9BILA